MTRDRIFLLCSFASILGVFLFPFFQIGKWILFMLMGISVSLAFLLTEEKARILCIAIFFLAAGFLRFGYFPQITDMDKELQPFTGKKVNLECEIVKMPEHKNGKQQITLLAKEKGFPRGKILAFMSAYGDYSYGDTVSLKGTLKIPESFDDFDYRKYLFQKNIYFISYYPKLEKTEEGKKNFYSAIYDFREKADANITKILPSPQGNIMSAMTLGMNSDEIKEAMGEFNKTGTSHIIVVSGSHLVIIISILSALFLAVGISRNRLFYLLVAAITCFIILSGSGSSAIRSGIMAFAFLFAEKIGRPKYAFNALMLSAALMIFINPYILSSDISFQLSFLATFGIVWILPRLEKKLKNLPEFGGTKSILLSTFAAQIATLPIIVLNFKQFSLLSFLANILILPTVTFLMSAGFLLIILSFVNFTAAQIISWPIYLILSYYLSVVDFLSKTDFGLIKF